MIHIPLRSSISMLMSAALLTACGGGDDANDEAGMRSVQVVRPVVNTQCALPTTRVSDLDSQLRSSNVVPIAQYCASDGFAYAAVCGAPFGFLAVFEIPRRDVATAERLGFQEYVGAGAQPIERAPCPAE